MTIINIAGEEQEAEADLVDEVVVVEAEIVAIDPCIAQRVRSVERLVKFHFAPAAIGQSIAVPALKLKEMMVIHEEAIEKTTIGLDLKTVDLKVV